MGPYNTRFIGNDTRNIDKRTFVEVELEFCMSSILNETVTEIINDTVQYEIKYLQRSWRYDADMVDRQLVAGMTLWSVCICLQKINVVFFGIPYIYITYSIIISNIENAKNIIGKRVLVSHLMMAVANGFDTLLVKHTARGVIDRLALLRLLSIIDHTEGIIEDSKNVSIKLV